ncbi:nucleotidyltransferase family protein [Alterisphingorhabdus coralli]|uniref:Nucleotidyltransferase domain-containing protein n=1 Tax=Alterisphingorhabdus coralli TaxID=3071408 RepID=A0AA97F7Q3_9SPHN|nr:nucleotidyltransferase domain-containing protein [Parasphingorhabdus sp. SCSIO 66989]WOE75006.1 nucleotidyltransferase domain-containing protein [Parasphingorhabdus sp. SCSIO 66989]
MTQKDILDTLRQQEAQLRKAGLSALYLFGSVARNEAGSSSDIDLACDIDDAKPIGVLGLLSLQSGLKKALAQEVDLVERAALRGAVQREFMADMVRVF